MSDRPLQMGAREWALLVVLSVLWGGSFFFFKVLVAALPPFTVVLGRVGIAALDHDVVSSNRADDINAIAFYKIEHDVIQKPVPTLWHHALALNFVLLARRDPMPTSVRMWGAFAVMGLLNNVVPFSLIVFGETRISSGLASILNATTPIFAVLAAHALTDNERLTWPKGVGVLFGFLAAAVLIGPTALAGLAGSDGLGKLSCLAAALVYALAGIYGRRFRNTAPPKIATGQITASTIVLIPIALFVDRPWLLPPPHWLVCAAFLGIALLSTALAYLI